MLPRVIAFVFIVVLCFGALALFDAIEPTIAANVAANQLSDSEDAAIVMRNYHRMVDTVSSAVSGVIFLSAVWLFWGPAVVLLKSFVCGSMLRLPQAVRRSGVCSERPRSIVATDAE